MTIILPRTRTLLVAIVIALFIFLAGLIIGGTCGLDRPCVKSSNYLSHTLIPEIILGATILFAIVVIVIKKIRKKKSK
jgi:hypothetical protein